MWLVFSWKSESSSEDVLSHLRAYLGDIPLLDSVDIATPSYVKSRENSQNSPEVKQTVTADMKKNYIAWSYPKWEDVREYTNTIEDIVYDSWYYMITNQGNITYITIGPFSTSGEGVAEARAYAKAQAGSDLFPNSTADDLDAYGAPIGYQGQEQLDSGHVVTTTRVSYELTERNVFIVAVDALRAKLPENDRRHLRFTLRVPGTTDWRNRLDWKLMVELYPGKHLNFTVNGENAPVWDQDDVLDLIGFKALVAEEGGMQDEAIVQFDLDFEEKTITGTVKDDFGAEEFSDFDVIRG